MTQGQEKALIFLVLFFPGLVSLLFARGAWWWANVGSEALLGSAGVAFLLSSIAHRRRLGPDAE